jgi:hypothetical protein
VLKRNPLTPALTGETRHRPLEEGAKKKGKATSAKLRFSHLEYREAALNETEKTAPDIILAKVRRRRRGLLSITIRQSNLKRLS